MVSPVTKRLPLHEKHIQKSAKLGLFGEWEVPLYYTTILEEHDAVRSRAGIFDISHMGRFYLEGPNTVSFLEELLPRRIAAMKHGQALYMPLLNEKGGFVDDIIVYRAGDKRFYIIVNAGNLEKDLQWFTSRVPSGVEFKDLSPKTGLLALQGPLAAAILEEAFPGNDFKSLKYYGFKEWEGGLVARTGYTGEDGFEISLPGGKLASAWDRLFETGQKHGLAAAGFGARDTLRLEAGMLLYGHDMNDEVTPLEAGIPWAVDLTKESFTGREPLVNQKAAGIQKKVIGFEMLDRGIPRQDHDLSFGGKAVGKVTSGSFSPTLKKNIGIGFVPVQLSAPGTEIDVIIREKALKAKIVPLPFYKRRKG